MPPGREQCWGSESMGRHPARAVCKEEELHFLG